MSSTPPFVAQERPDTCAIACVRMILAQHGRQVSEVELIREADLAEGGLTPAEMIVLARKFGLEGREAQLDSMQLSELVDERQHPIVFLFRRPLDGQDMTHAVIPIRRTRQYVTVLDPLQGKRRLSIRKFERARELVGRWAVVWKTK